MLAFRVNAPGKVILHGEHSVVYGRPALAATIALDTWAELRETDTTEIVIHLRKLNSTQRLSIAAANGLVAELEEKFNATGDTKVDHFDAIIGELDVFLNGIGDGDDMAKMPIRRAMKSVLFLLTGILVEQKCAEISNGFELIVDSQLPMGAGLGSSASFGVCLAATFYAYAKVDRQANLIPHRRAVSDWAFKSERIMHGNPSGLDNTICSLGGLVKFYKGKEPTAVEFGEPLPIILVDTRVSRNTIDLVRRVVDFRSAHTELVEAIFTAMGHLVDDAAKLYQRMAAGDLEQLIKLVTTNNDLLRALGVSHPALEKVFAIADRHGVACKLSGAGGGGCAFIVPSAGVCVDKLEAELRANHFGVMRSDVGGPGFTLTHL